MAKVLHASGSGYFPYCLNSPGLIQEYENNPGLIDILTLRGSLEAQMYFYWVVKELSVSWSGVDDDGDAFSKSFTISADQPAEENTVCGRTFSTTDGDINERGGVVYFGPLFFGVLGLDEETYAGLFSFSYLDPAARYGIRFGQLFQDYEYYDMNLGKYSFSIPMHKSPFAEGGEGQWDSFEIVATSWFSYGGTWNTSTGQLI